MSQSQTRPEIIRHLRVEFNEECTLFPWDVKAILVNLSLTGALLKCQELPDDLYTTIFGKLAFRGLEFAGEFVRLDKKRVAMAFKTLDPSLTQQLKHLLEPHSNN